ncbi:FG-GAP-like repeat-containing protein [Myxococcus stipitatus]|uniref:RHS repeat-associated core domain-containing protein n=1 Tax=Myxococcus stipitatus TaxID=83455 RepID=UPI001F3DCC84|nr:RHS repeat-associated core domain-containing protein [Myxococcus stipitatus]MCE9666686.1 FG-GAP-like repeat-containing protein [Myxococcus stipitatus]
MKRTFSVLTLVVYFSQWVVSCGPATHDGGDGDERREVPWSKLSGEDELPARLDVLVPSEVDGEGFVPGAVPGKLSVSDDGAATYDVPLWVPPGRAGVQPALSLNYNSRGGNGFLGVGWSLSGLSQIARCNKTLAQDGMTAPVRFDATDALCVDGRRLIQTGSTGAGEKTYTTEFEEFSHIVERAADAKGPLWFEVYLKNGMVLEYGRTTDSRLEGFRMYFKPATSNASDATVVGDHASQAVRYGWSISRARDRFGNYMDYGYRQRVHGNASEGYAYEQLPSSIRYTGTTTSEANVTTPLREVSFRYDENNDRRDVLERFVSGFKVVTRKVLKDVVMYGPVGDEQPTALKLYCFKYRNDSVSGRSLLSSISECDAFRACKRPTVFTWELGTPGTGRVPVVSGSDPNFERIALPTVTPFINASASALDEEGFRAAPDLWTLQTLDVNGDGRDDLLYRHTPADSNGKLLKPVWYLKLNVDGRSFGPSLALSSLPVPKSGDNADDLRTVDLNNDGKVDVVGLSLANTDPGDPANGAYVSYLSNGSGFTAVQSDTYDLWFDLDAPTRVPAMHLADLHGDGLPDAVRSLTRGSSSSPFPYEWGVMAAQPVGSSAPVFSTPPQRTGVGAGLDHAGYSVDVDGDGATEVLVREPAAGSPDGFSRFLVAVGVTSNGSVGKKLTTTLSTAMVPNSTQPTLIYRQHWFMDINGDGLPDSVSARRQRQGQEGGNIEIAINTGNGFAPPVTQALPAGAEVSFSRVSSAHRFVDVGVRVIDFNLDGKQDLLLTDHGLGVGRRDSHVLLQSTGTGFVVLPLDIPIGHTPGMGNVISASVHSPALQSLKGSGWGMKFTQLLDANGDGLTDIIQMEAGQLVLYLRNAYKPDVLKAVEDGLKNRASVTYEATTFASAGTVANHHTPGTCTYPLSCNLRGQWLVSRHTESGRDGYPRTFEYTYEGGRTDLKGRGWLGFSSRTVTDALASRRTTTRYHNDGYFAGFYAEAHRPYEELTEVTTRTAVVDTFRRTFEYGVQYRHGNKVVFPYISKVTNYERDGFIGQFRQLESVNQYDAYGNQTVHEEFSVTDGNRVVTTSTYDNYPGGDTHLLGLLRRQVTTSEPGGGGAPVSRTREYRYCDGSGCQPMSHRPRRIIVEPDAAPPERDDVWSETVITYNGLGLPTQTVSTDAAGRTRKTEFHYDAFERMFLSARIAHPTTASAGPVLREDYAYLRGFGSRAEVEDVNGVRTRWYYDGFGRLRAEDGPTAGDSIYSYSEEEGRPLVTHREVDVASCGVVASTLNLSACVRNGDESQIRYDSMGRPVQSRTRAFDGSWSFVDTRYDSLGHVERVSMPRSEQGAVNYRRFEYDNRGRVLFVRNPDGTFQEHAYSGWVTYTWDEKRNMSLIWRDALGRIVQTADRTGSANVQTNYTYGAFNLPATIVDAAGNEVRFTYDRLGRRTLLEDPDVGSRTTAYTAFGDVRQMTDGKGNTLTQVHDGVGRLLSVTNQPPAGAAAQVSTYVWDTAANGLGQLHSTLSPDGVGQVYEYDALGRRIHERWNIQGQEYRLSSTYDAQGRLQTLGYPEVPGRARMGVLYNYTAYGQVQSLQDVNTGQVYWQTTSRSASGLLTGELFGNGVSSIRRYDGVGQLRFIDTTGPMGPVQQLTYDYEANGNLRNRIDRLTQVAEDFQYDHLDRLKTWKVNKGCNEATFQYDYDDIGNLTYRSSKLGSTSQAPFEEVAYGYGAGAAGPHAVTSVGGDLYAYDGNGNLERWQRQGGALRELEYSYFNLPKRIVEGAKQWTFGYTAGQERAWKQDNQGALTVYVGGAYERRVKPSGTSHVFFVNAPGRVVAQVEWTALPGSGSEAISYLHADHLGSIASITTTGGGVVAQQKYDPFGLRKNPLNPALPLAGPSSHGVQRGFTGHEEDDDLGLVDMGGRVYDPKLARFLSPDPLVQAPFFSQSLNRYTYAFNNPLNFIDPSGFEADIPYIGISARVGEPGFREDDRRPAPEPSVAEPETPFVQPDPHEAWDMGTAESVPSNVGAADQNGSRVSRAEGVAIGAAGAVVGAGLGLGVTYGVGLAAGLFPPLGIALGVGIAAYGVYKLVDGGAEALYDSGKRIWNDEASASDYFGVGAAVGGLASGLAAKPTFGVGRAHGMAVKAEAAKAIQLATTMARLPRIRATQVGLRDPAKVDAIKESMLRDPKFFDKVENAIGASYAEGTHYIHEGHHRMTAAIELAAEQGTSRYVDELLMTTLSNPYRGTTVVPNSRVMPLRNWFFRFVNKHFEGR